MIQATLILGKVDKPDGKDVGDFRVTVSFPGQDIVTLRQADPTFTLDVTRPGTYTVSAARLATDGTVIGIEVSDTYTTPVPTPEQVDVPVSITFTVVQ